MNMYILFSGVLCTHSDNVRFVL